MVVYQYPFKEKLNIPPSVLALGFFDGVHIAHRDLMKTAKEEARKRGISFGIFTFSSGGIKQDSAKIYSDEEKAEIFKELGVDFTVFADFPAISGCSPECFVKDILCRDLNCKACVAGFNFRFGKGASGGANELSRLMKDAGAEAIIREEIKGEGGVTLSTSLIRNLISDGRISEANRILVIPYNIKGRVLHGRAVGRSIGFPTVNTEIEKGRIVPMLGVYASAIPIDGRIYLGVTNVGVCPTFEKRQVHLETNIIGFEGDLYGRELRIYLLDFIRPEKAFSSPDELKMQINVDKNTVINRYGDIKWQELGLK